MTKRLRTLAATILMGGMFMAQSAMAYDIKVKGINYNYVGKNQVEVTWGMYTGTVTIPAHVEYDGKTYTVSQVEDMAFHELDVESVILPESVERVGKSAFEGCQRLVSVRMSKGVKEIGYHAFKGCQALQQVAISATTAPKLDKEAFDPDAYTNVSLTVGADSYREAEVWSQFQNIQH